MGIIDKIEQTLKASNFTCPRRAEIGQQRKMDQDHWRKPHLAMSGATRPVRTCSYCGSMHPGVLLADLEAADGWVQLGPTDKTYKVYIGSADTYMEAKFYFQHFDEEQQMKFIELMNARPRPFTIGYPGHFHPLPFFVTTAKES